MTTIGFFYKDFYLMKIEVMDAMYADTVVHYKFPEYGRFYTKAFKVISITDMKTKTQKLTYNKYKINNCYRETEIIYYYKLDTVAFSANINNFIKKKYFTINGEYKEYHDNGQLKNHRFYSNSLLDGDFFEYTDDNILIRKSMYTNGKLNGPTIFYTSSGEILREELYTNGQIVETNH